MHIRPVSITPVAQRKLVAAAPAATAVKAKTAADTPAPAPAPEKPSGFFGKVADWMLEKKQNIDKLPGWEKALIGVVGFVVGWKVAKWVDHQLEKKEGERYDSAQNQYLKLQELGTPALVDAVNGEEKFKERLKDFVTDPLKLDWKAFTHHVVMAETARPTTDATNKPVVLIALAKNKAVSDDVIENLERGMNLNPSFNEFWKPVREAIAAR